MVYSSHAQISKIEMIDTIGLKFSHKAGFYSSPFALTITSTDSTVNIVYTIDGSNPQTSVTSYTSIGNHTSLSINPDITLGRAETPTFLVRASIIKDGYEASKPITQSYIFLNKVYTQSHPGGSWPSNKINRQVLHYDMSLEVVNDSRYANDLEEVFTQIPSICITTDIENLFESDSGIYVNTTEHGAEWEKTCSVELLNPDKSDGFSANAGLRIRGGASRLPNYPRHAFRLFFREEYGQAKLEFPLFGDEGVSEFDKIDFRCAQNYSWANPNNKPERGTLIREVFSRDTQGKMGQPYTRSRYYHLFLNGMYWGLYQSQERPEARYASSYFGSNNDDYDVIKVVPNIDTWSYEIEATDGNLDAWREIYNMCKLGFSSNQNYFKLLGLGENGKAEPGGTVFVDIDNLIDYMILIFYTGNFDSPASSFLNYDPNNFYAIYDREDKSKGFQFFSHDAEHSLMSEAVSPGIGINENRVEPSGMVVNDFYKFHPQWLHHKLMENTEYKSRFTDRVAYHFHNNGALSEKNNRDRFLRRKNEIDMAIIGESARWSTYGGSQNIKTKDDDWLPEIQSVIDDFFPFRTNIVLDQLKNAGIWTDQKAPVFSESDVVLDSTEYILWKTRTITVSNPNTSGEIYYTLNGKDPRDIGGHAEITAVLNNEDFSLQVEGSMHIKARVYNNDKWSPLIEKKFLSNTDDLSALKVTELHYHPTDSINGIDTIYGKSFEFIEFRNTGNTALNLSGITIDSAVYYSFPEKTILPPDNYYVVATKPKYFYKRYGMIPSGNCERFFSNSGEFIWMTDKNKEQLLSFTYSDDFPWPVAADGDGVSLSSELNKPKEDPNFYSYWRASKFMHGTPFSNDSSIIRVGISDNKSIQNELRIYPNPAKDFIQIENTVSGELTYKILALNGNLVKQGIARNRMINVSELSRGLYLLKIIIKDQSCVKKLIIQ